MLFEMVYLRLIAVKVEKLVVKFADGFIVKSPCKKRLVKKHILRVISFLSKRGLNISEKRNLEHLTVKMKDYSLG
jgi:hypothetical protein